MEENKLVALIRKLRKGGPQGRSGLGMGMSITRKHDDTLPDNALYRRFVRQGLYDPEKDDYVVHTETKFEGEKLTFDEDDAVTPAAAAPAPSSSLTKRQVKQKLLHALEQAGAKGIKRRKLAESICPGQSVAGLDDLIDSALASLVKKGAAVEDGKRVCASAKPAPAAAGSKRSRSEAAAAAGAGAEPAVGKADKAAKSSKKDKSEKKAAKSDKKAAKSEKTAKTEKAASKSDKKKKSKKSKQ